MARLLPSRRCLSPLLIAAASPPHRRRLAAASPPRRSGTLSRTLTLAPILILTQTLNLTQTLTLTLSVQVRADFRAEDAPPEQQTKAARALVELLEFVAEGLVAPCLGGGGGGGSGGGGGDAFGENGRAFLGALGARLASVCVTHWLKQEYSSNGGARLCRGNQN